MGCTSVSLSELGTAYFVVSEERVFWSVKLALRAFQVGSVCLGDCAFTYSAEIPSTLAIYPESGSPVDYTTVEVGLSGNLDVGNIQTFFGPYECSASQATHVQAWCGSNSLNLCNSENSECLFDISTRATSCVCDEGYFGGLCNQACTCEEEGTASCGGATGDGTSKPCNPRLISLKAGESA